MIESRIARRAVLGIVTAASLAVLPAQAAGAAAGDTHMQPSARHASIFRRNTGIDDSGSYRHELQACRSGRTQQALETCLEEARNAADARRRGQLQSPGEDFAANALARCRPLAGEFKAACEARVMGFGETSGSVGGGGLLRQLEIAVVPRGSGPVTVQPQTDGPVVLIPSAPR